jgi:hypothetical protein
MARGRPRTAQQYTPHNAPAKLSVPDIDWGGMFTDQKLVEPPGGSADEGVARHGDSSRVTPELLAPPTRIAYRRPDLLERLLAETINERGIANE